MGSGLWRGYDFKTADPGEVESMNCETCGASMVVKRNVNSATSWAEGMAGKSHLHDTFTCPNAQTDWHRQVVKLLMEIGETSSGAVEKILRTEIKKILKTKKATKKVY